MDSKKSTVGQLNDEMYNASCIHCGGTEYIQLWPHRNNHGNMIGFVFACARCKDVVRGITLEIHGIRGHSEETRQPEVPAKPRRMMGNPFPAAIGDYHSREHDETPKCAFAPACVPVDSPPAKPRRMMGNPHAVPGSVHAEEHDEREGCARGYPCQPMDTSPAEPRRRMKANAWHRFEHDEVKTCSDFPACEPVDPPADTPK